MKDYRNAIIIHGGGLVDSSKEVIRRIAQGLSATELYDSIFLGRYSFMSLYDSSLWLEYNLETDELLEHVRGTFLGTSRGIDLSCPELMQKAIKELTDEGVDTVIVCGGDGSSRQCAEIYEKFIENGINIIFAVPLTVDGINGGYSIGLDQAVREAIRQIENAAATSLETRDNGEYSIVAVELQGRNRDDILANVLQHFWRQEFIADCSLRDICLKVVPANYKSDEQKLINEINATDCRTLLLVSEGADFKISELQKKTHRKVRTVVVGHAVQSNGMTTEYDMYKYSEWLTDVVKIICQDSYCSYCIVNDGISRWTEPIDYYAKLNPRESQKATLSRGLEVLLKNYMA